MISVTVRGTEIAISLSRKVNLMEGINYSSVERVDSIF